VLFRTLVPALFESTAFLRWKLQAFRSRLVNTDRDAEPCRQQCDSHISHAIVNLNADSRHEVTVGRMFTGSKTPLAANGGSPQISI
jgi:hypothetical protein